MKNCFPWSRAILAAVAVSSSAAALPAPMTEQELTEKSAVIVDATATDVSCFSATETLSVFETTLAPSKTYKGEPGASLKYQGSIDKTGVECGATSAPLPRGWAGKLYLIKIDNSDAYSLTFYNGYVADEKLSKPEPLPACSAGAGGAAGAGGEGGAAQGGEGGAGGEGGSPSAGAGGEAGSGAAGEPAAGAGQGGSGQAGAATAGSGGAAAGSGGASAGSATTAGSGGAAAGAGGAAAGSGGAAAGAAGGEAPAEDDGGCSAAGGLSPRGGGLAALGAALGAALLARRRRR